MANLTASICHNDDDCRDSNHRRVKLFYRSGIPGKAPGVWEDEEGNVVATVTGDSDPKSVLAEVYCFDGWDLRL